MVQIRGRHSVGSVALEVVGVGNDPLTDFFYQVATSGMYLTRVG
jgi:hypothetical protein